MGIFDMINGGGLQNMDEEQAQKMLDQIDNSQIEKGMRRMIDMYVSPHLYEIRDSVQNQYPDSEVVRQKYKNLSDDRQEEVFHGTMQDLLTLAVKVRERPRQGMLELKAYLRDPRATEALLLIFENPNINPDYREQLKDYASDQLFLLGTQLLPEMYSEEEIRRALNIMGIDPDQREQLLNDYKKSQNGN